MKPRVVVLSGAGISAESGIQTFRDSDGLWEGYSIEEVATPGAWRRNPSLVLDFYNMRRRMIKAAKPNAAHIALAELENDVEVTIITQNIDDLHERAGSNHVIHLHGEIFKMRSEMNEMLVYPIEDDMIPGQLAEDGAPLRPHIVWFEEAVPMLDEALRWVRKADYFAVVGTSLLVYPAAGLVNYAGWNIPKFIVDKSIPTHGLPFETVRIEQPATIGVPMMTKLIRERLKRE